MPTYHRGYKLNPYLNYSPQKVNSRTNIITAKISTAKHVVMAI